MEKMNGLVAAAFTPFRDGTVNTEVIPDYAAGLVRNGVSGVFVNGTTGESLSLTVDERLELADAWMVGAPDPLKIIIHVGQNSLPACRQMAAHAQQRGASAISAMAPTFFKPDLNGLVDYAAQIAAAAPELPFYFYHMPAMTGVSFAMADFLVAAESKIPNLAGVKFTFENLMDFKLCMDLEGGKYDMVFGRDEILLCGLMLGAKAAIGSTYNFAAPLYGEMCRAFFDGDLVRANELQLLSMKLVDLCVRVPGGNPLAAIKALSGWRLGLDLGPMRAPAGAVPDECLQQLFRTAQSLAEPYLTVCG